MMLMAMPKGIRRRFAAVLRAQRTFGVEPRRVQARRLRPEVN